MQKYSEFKDISYYFYMIYNNTTELNEYSINRMYENHQNDEIGCILKQLVTQLIPYYRSLDTGHGFIKLTLDASQYFAKEFEYLNRNDIHYIR